MNSQSKQLKVISFSASRRSVGWVILSLKPIKEDTDTSNALKLIKIDGHSFFQMDDLNPQQMLKYMVDYFTGWDPTRYGTENVVINKSGKNNHLLSMAIRLFGFSVYILKNNPQRYESDMNKFWDEFPELAELYKGNDYPELANRNDEYLVKLEEEGEFKDEEESFTAEELRSKMVHKKPLVFRDIRVAANNGLAFIEKMLAMNPSDMPMLFRKPLQRKVA